MGGGDDDEEVVVVVRARQLPWRERMRHVSWKVRREAHLDLAAACRTIAGPADPRVHEFGPLFRYTVRDDNPDVQELALDSLLTFLAVVDPCDASRYAKDICDSLVARCLGGRPITIEKAKTIFLMFIELHAVDIFLDSMENAVRKKVQTVVIKSVELLQQALQQFGSDVVSAERIMKVLPELLESSDSRVRKASEVLAIELSRWIGRKALRRSVIKKIAERRKGNLSELLLDAQQMTKPKPTRMLRSRQESTIGGELFREKSVGNTFRNAANALYSDAGANNSACKGIVEKHEPTKTTDVRVTNKSRDATDKFVEDRTIETANTSVIDISSEIRNLKIYNPGTVVGNANISNYCVLKLDMKDPVKTFFNKRNCIGHHRWWCYTNSDLCYEHGHKTRRSWLLPRSGMFFQYVEVRGKLMCFVGDACTSWLSAVITEKTVAEFPHESGKKYFVEGSWGKLSWKKLTCSGNYSPSLGTTTLGGESLEDACLIIYRHVNDGDAFDKEVLQACFTRVIVHLWDTLRNNEALRRVLCAFNPLFSSCVNELGRDLVPDLKNWKQICQNLEDSIINDIPFVQIHRTSPDSVLAALERIRILYQNNQVRVPYDFRNLPIKPDEWGRKGRRGAVRKDGTQSLGSKSSGGQAHDLGAPSRYPSFVLRDWKKLDSQDTVEDLFDMDIVSDDDMMDCLDGTMYQTDNAMLPKQMPYHPAPSRDLLKSGQSQRKENQDNLLMSKFVSAKEFPCLCTMEFRLFLLQLLMRSCLSTFTPRAHEEMLWQC